MFGTQSEENVRSGLNLLCCMLAVIGVVNLLSTVVEARNLFLINGSMSDLAQFYFFFQHSMFAKSGEILTRRVRKMAFAAMLRQNVGWFDEAQNNTGALCTRLSVDASRIQGVSYGITQSFVNVNWKQT